MYNELLEYLKKTMFYEGKVMSIYEVENDLAKFLLYRDEKSVYEADECVEANKLAMAKIILSDEEMRNIYEEETRFIDSYDVDIIAVMIVIAKKAQVSLETVNKMIKTYEKLGVVARLNELNGNEELNTEIEEQIQKFAEIKNGNIILEQIYAENHLNEEEGIVTLATEISERFNDEMKDLINKDRIYTR